MERVITISIYMLDPTIQTDAFVKAACEMLHQLDEQDLQSEHVLFNNNSEPLFKFTNNLNEVQSLR